MTSSVVASEWSDIGRRIGKKLRDILMPVPPDSGPTPEERAARRKQDVRKGFSYFDTIDEVRTWREEEVDALQVANTPLLARATRTQDLSQLGNKPGLVLCHDYMGGYHDYESVRPAHVKDELYSCEYLQYVDTFIYFSHKLVCIPPPTWTNLLHRNGVKVLGTLLLEPQTLDVEQILDMEDGRYIIAEILASMARRYSFDGWLLNVEKTFPSNRTQALIAFVRHLKRKLGDGLQVVWYDALNSMNEVIYQNGLTSKNLSFAQASSALFTNYKWTEGKLLESKKIALSNNTDVSKICFGIDVWAQNTNMPGPPRITFPRDGGGGTNTGIAIKVLKEHGFRPAIFGPAWSFEHFSTASTTVDRRSIAKNVDMSLWTGSFLPPDLGCDCKKGRPHHTAFYQNDPITKHTVEAPTGSSTYFDTDFSKAFLEIEDENGQFQLRPTLGSQSLLPNFLPHSGVPANSNWSARRILYGELETKNRSSLEIYTKLLEDLPPEREVRAYPIEQRQEPKEALSLRLYSVLMPLDDSLSIRIFYSRLRESRSAEVGLYTATRSSSCPDLKHQYHALRYNTTPNTEAQFRLGHESGSSILVEIGVYCKGFTDFLDPMHLLRITRLMIQPSAALVHGTTDFQIADVKMVQRGESPDEDRRLVWRWTGERGSWPETIPWSKSTGPYSHFTIVGNGYELGNAYCTEFPLLETDLTLASQNQGDSELSFTVTGHYFGGLHIEEPSSATAILYE